MIWDHGSPNIHSVGSFIYYDTVMGQVLFKLKKLKSPLVLLRVISNTGLSIEASYHLSSGSCELLSPQILGHVGQQIIEKFKS